MVGEDLLHPVLLGCDDGGMNDCIQVIKAAALKSELGQTGAVEMSIGVYDIGTEGADDLLIDEVAGFHHFTAEGIGFNDVCAEIAEDGCDGAFAAPEAAG
jgi:hypothetical protein